MFRLRIKRKQLRVIENISEPVKGRIRDALKVLKEDPVPVKSYDIKKLQGYDSVYRIREWVNLGLYILLTGLRKLFRSII